MLRELHLYDLFVLSFAQLVLATILVLSPLRELDARFRWKGSKIADVVPGVLGAAAISAAACFATAEVSGLPVGGLEIAAYILTIVSVVVIALRPDCGVFGQVFYASFLAAGISFIAFAALVAGTFARSIGEEVASSFLIFLDLVAFIVWGSNVNYVSDALSRTRHGRPAPEADLAYQPMVSLHIAAYNEPPALLINTIKAVERIDYPNFEIVVIDNNTSDPTVWKPVEEYCRNRERVRFVHVAPWPGYKAGACNLALRRYTDPRAEIIGLIDADDVVQPYYLKETIPYFSDPHLGYVQSFEGNRDFEGSAYYQACVDSYQGFYLTVMSSRNERDSVPFVGTMGLFRRSALLEVGGWNEWCISEDTEASLRVAKAGWSGLYLPRCFGRGVVPPSYAGLNTQRHRWCFGAMQIFRLHWRSLMPWDRSSDNNLTSAQRRDYLMASLGWTRDLLMFVFALALLAITGLWLAGSHFALIPLAGDKSLLPLSLIFIATICMSRTLRLWTTMSHRRALLSLLISLSASWITALACIEGLARRDGVFLRTSKSGSSHHRLRKAFRLCWWESVLAAGLYASAALLSASRHPPVLLVIIIAFQGTVYLCSPIVSFWNLRAQRVPVLTYRQRFERQRLRQMGRRTRLGVLGAATVSVAALGLGGVAGVFVAPSALLRANAVTHETVSLRSVLASSARTEVYVKLDSTSDKGTQFFPVTYVRLTQLPGSKKNSSAGVSLSFATSSLALLDSLAQDVASADGIAGLTLAVRSPAVSKHPGRIELVESFRKVAVTWLVEDLTGSPSGDVTLTFGESGPLVTSPKELRATGPFARASFVSPAPATRVYLVAGSTGSTSEPRYPLTSVQLSQLTPSAAGSPARLRLSFNSTSLALLDEFLGDRGSSGGVVPALTLVVQEPGNRRWAAAETRDTFYNSVVLSLGENLSGSPVGNVTLSVAG